MGAPIISLAEREAFHFIGIGGVGMSGIARVLLSQGYKVTGSDLNSSEITCQLEQEGALIFPGHSPHNLGTEITRIVVSSAISSTNPEVLEAQRRGLSVLHRGDMLAFLLNQRKGIAVAGAHGKTTTSAMISLVLERNGLDPTILVGGHVKEIKGNARLGSSEYLVAEADESDGSFLRLAPYCAVVTNVENDHLDYYQNLNNIREAFFRFLEQVKPEGFAVVCMEDPFLRSLTVHNSRPYVTYGFSREAVFYLENVESRGLETWGDVYYRKRKLGRLTLSVPGQHNLLNALAAIGVGHELGLNFRAMTESLRDFRGVHRRFEVIGEVNGILVVDDYAHHPTEIKATLKAAQQVKARRVIAVFQPHRFTRTHFLREEFGNAFRDANLIIINEIYPAGESPIVGVTAQLLVEEIRKQTDQPVEYIPTREEIVDYLAQVLEPGDLVITMGAGHIWTVGQSLINRLKDLHASCINEG
ncbi:MAG: UDP-N-acetylmuramate--L-alanine ligase [Syntrophomonadaceae bacterium]|nr:UDP-N-acetylmuramate--L-alanine ligase [Syntrophomonadaceae bacterium]